MQPIYNSGRGRSPDEAFGRLPKFIWADRYIKSDEYYNHEKDFCDNLMCGRRLVYSDKIGKMFCSECFSHLTKEETEALFAPNINAEDKVSDDIETGIIHPNEEGFIPMKRGGKSDAIAQREEYETGGKTIARQPSRMEQLRAKKQARAFPGLDDDLRRTVAKAGGTIVSTNEHIPTTGDTSTLSGDDLERERIFRTRDRTYRIK